MSWKLSVPCTRAQAEAAGEIDGAALVATEEDEAADRWLLDVYVEDEPDAALLAQVAALGTGRPAVERLADADWVSLSQAGLPPVREGRFVVHTPAHAVTPAAGERAFLIGAGQAFGTGHHATTAGCLAMLDALERGGARCRNVLDLGTGTGLLALAAADLWPAARITATDIDPVAIAVAGENMVRNDVGAGDEAGRILLLVADGARDPAIGDGAPYDLVIANILAGPLIAMAAEIAAIAAPGATLVLAGLLAEQSADVAAAYAAAGCGLAATLARGDWHILRLTAGAAARTGNPSTGDRAGWATDGR